MKSKKKKSTIKKYSTKLQFNRITLNDNWRNKTRCTFSRIYQNYDLLVLIICFLIGI